MLGGIGGRRRRAQQRMRWLDAITNSQSSLKLMTIEPVIPPNHLILCRPLLPSIFPNIRVFSNESVLCISIGASNTIASKVLELLLQHQSFQWIFRTVFLSDGLVGSPYSPRNSQESSHHSSKASILWCSAFFMVQLSHPYMTAGKTIALTR